MAILNKANLQSNIADPTGQTTQVANQSNTHRANNVSTDIEIQKSVSKSYVVPEEQITVTTMITNNTDVDISNIKIKDTLGEGAQFVEKSVKVGGVAREDLNPIIGFDLDVTVGGSGGDFSIEYKILVDKVPLQWKFSNITQAQIMLDSTLFTLNSNEVEVNILENEIWLTKTASAKAVKQGDTLTYTIEIANTGTLKNTELFFTDPIPVGTTFVDGSVKINGATMADYNPATGFTLPDLDPDATITVEFSVTVD